MEPKILITGANKGIGLEAVRQLAARGARVILTARNRAAGEKAAEKMGRGVTFVHLDVTDGESIARAVAEVEAEHGHLDVLVNNAAVLLDDGGGVLDLEVATIQRTFEANLLGPLRVTQAFLPLLQRGKGRRIINMSSGAGQLSDGLQDWAPAYSMSKTALNSLTQHLASALPDFAVNSVSPGWVRTDMGGSAAPLGVEEGADTIVWLALDAPHTLTGKFVRERREIEW